MLPDFKKPWEPIDGLAAASAEAELARELGPAHPLRGKQLRAVATRSDNDDVLFMLTDEAPKCAVIHLTNTQRAEPEKWPETKLFPSLDEWKRDCMMPDAEAWAGGT